MEIAATRSELAPSALTVRMFGQLAVARQGVAVELPPSRKVRALLGYLAVAPHPVGRSRLCQLLGSDIPNDPKGELRWCLSKMRAILDEPGRARILSDADMVSLALDDSSVDAIRVEDAMRRGPQTLEVETLQGLCDLFVGDFLEGLDLDRSPLLDHWLATQRSRYRACHAVLLEQLVDRLPGDPVRARPYVERWVGVAPFDPRAHLLLARTLLECGLTSDAEGHVTAAIRLFEAEGLEADTIRRGWQELRRTDAAVTRPSAQPREPEREGERSAEVEVVPARSTRASIAITPFSEPVRLEGKAGLAAGLTHDIIARLARLRNLFVIARGSVFALAERGIGPDEAARRLNVDYFVTGVIKRSGGRLTASVELVETSTTRIVWSEDFDIREDDAFLVLDEIGDMIVASIANEVENAERNRAILKPPNSLNAWESYHRGLWHMYRFTKADNDLAYQFFKRSTEADPTFARAFAGISFTHWQNSFQHWADREREADLAFEAAGRSLIADDHDPTAHWAMGRAMWLRNRQDQAVVELQRAVSLSPNFALGHYALAFVQCQSGDPSSAILAADHSRSLSPFDPLLFGMLGSRAMAHIRMGQYEEAAEWALKAAARPNAHNIILAIAAYCLALSGRIEEGRAFVTTIRQSVPSFGVNDFLATFRFPQDAETQFRKGAEALERGR